ncbi:MAG: iron-containing alcohol dehydrogenase, partial [Candidatus Fimivivens sp.]
MNNFKFYSPTKVIFGKDVESRVGAEVKGCGVSKLLVHYGGGSVKKTGLLDRVEASLKAAGVDYILLGGAQPNPRLGLVHEGIALCRKEKVDMILAIGGGSTIDSAKAIAMGVPYDGDVWDFYAGKAKPTAALPTCNILTLAAAGSETSANTVITNEDGWMKRGFGNEMLRPVFTLMNPELLYTLPAYQT